MSSSISRTFKLSLIQLGNITSNKQENLLRVKDKILNNLNVFKSDVVVLPVGIHLSKYKSIGLIKRNQECFNSPYGVKYFKKYAEPIPEIGIKANDILSINDSPSVKMLSEIAKNANVFLIGGSIPEVDKDDKIYNTLTVYDNNGNLVGKHRKLHLFDIEIPNKITFKVNYIFSEQFYFINLHNILLGE